MVFSFPLSGFSRLAYIFQISVLYCVVGVPSFCS